MFDAESCIQPGTESQLLLFGRYTHGQGCGMDSHDGRSLESRLGRRLGDCGHRQEAWLARGLGGEGHPQSAQRCISADQGEALQDHGDGIQLHQGIERERQVACGNPSGYYDELWGHVSEVLDQSSPAHEAQEEIEKDDRQQRDVAGQRDDEEGALASTLVSHPRGRNEYEVLRTLRRVFFLKRNWPLLLRTLF